MFKLNWMADVLRAAGLKVVEEDGWKNRGKGEFGIAKAVLCHHTAGPKTGTNPSLTTVIKGRTGLSGPLCNLYLGRDGVWHTVAAGFANHAGKGKYAGITSGNTQMIGIEAENTGLPNDSPWPPVQVDSYARGCAALLKKVGLGAEMCLGHKEWAPGRKPDPSFSMFEFRKQVAHFMEAPAGEKPPVPEKPEVEGDPATFNVQYALLGLGYNPGPLDGDWGKLTRAALVASIPDEDEDFAKWFTAITKTS